MFRSLGGIAFAHLLAGRYDEATSFAEQALRERHNYLPALRDLAAAHALAGRQVEAASAMERLRAVAPSLRVASVREWLPLRRPDDLARLESGLRSAGLPE
jgi:tetratricopeptide (TPR) repeat protein